MNPADAVSAAAKSLAARHSGRAPGPAASGTGADASAEQAPLHSGHVPAILCPHPSILGAPIEVGGGRDAHASSEGGDASSAASNSRTEKPREEVGGAGASSPVLLSDTEHSEVSAVRGMWQVGQFHWLTHFQVGALARAAAMAFKEALDRAPADADDQSVEPPAAASGAGTTREASIATVAIRAANRVEFVVCDFGACLAGMAPVGVHASFSDAMTADMMEHCDARIHVCEAGAAVDRFAAGRIAGRISKVTALFVIRGAGAGASGDQPPAGEHTDALRKAGCSVEWFDAAIRRHLDAAVSPARQGTGAARMRELLRVEQATNKQGHGEPATSGKGDASAESTDEARARCLAPGLDDPDALPRGGPDSIFTLLYTSGSSGRAKGVRVTSRQFASIANSTACPLVTASFIPLSHSSDRFRLWEFVCNGGRVGLCHYDHSNWLQHEKSKK